VLDAIKKVSGFVKSNEAEFTRQVREASAVHQTETAKSHKKLISKEQKRVDELNTLIRRIYEDSVSGKLTDKRFVLLSAEYEQEQGELEQSIKTLQAELDSFDADTVRTDKFIEIVKKYTDFTELTAPRFTNMLKKIMVHEADKSSGERTQKVDIYLNFIGSLTCR
jgi:mevalonate kinase